jgi:hypothetical protein
MMDLTYFAATDASAAWGVDCTRPTVFSTHARERLYERVGMKERTLRGRLDRGECVNIGIAPAQKKEHLLFYSEKKDCCFVAIRAISPGSSSQFSPLRFTPRPPGL